MTMPTLNDLPAPPPGKTGWPWTEASEPLSASMAGGSAWPKISIVTPSYDQGPFIEETIRSVLLQGYPNLEYIVIDGGSTDESVKIIEKYAPWIDYWVSEQDRGQSHAINKGLQQCSGEIFNWINSDDFLTNEALRVIGSSFGVADALIGPGWYLGEEEIRLSPMIDFSFINLLQGYEGCAFHQQGVWLKTAKVRTCGGIDESFNWAMDRELYVRYSYNHPEVVYVDYPLGKFRLQPNSKSTKANDQFFKDHIRIGKKALQSEMTHPKLEEVCNRYIESLRWKLFVDSRRDEKGKNKISRVMQLIAGMLSDPYRRVNRYSLGAIRRVIVQ